VSTLAATTVVPLYAGFWRRAAASFLDGFVLLIPNIALAFALRSSPGLQFLAQLVLGALYYGLMHSSEGQATVGKRAFGIKVTDLEGERIGLARAIGRYFGVWLSTILLGIGLLMAAFTGRKQALHDMLCGTLVVNRHAGSAEVQAGGDTMPVTAGVWAMVVVLFGIPFFGGLLAAIAIPAYHDYTVRAKVAEVFIAAAPLRQRVEQAYAQRQSPPAGQVALDSRFASAAEITAEGHVNVSLTDEVARNGRIHWVPDNSSGSIQWTCSAEDVQPRYLPPQCRP
jgi:uncharacterized RDD family membrane protein YckC/Tfp pilus assembly major pilin PilA